MTSGLDSAIDGLKEELNSALKRVAEIKKMINNAYALKGEAPPYTDVDFTPVGSSMNIVHDQFFGKGLATAVKEFLRMKGRATKAQEIFDALNKGGFEWPPDWKDKERLKNLAISLSKNRNDFVIVRTSEGSAYGIWDFYPERKRDRKQQIQKSDAKENDSDYDDQDEESRTDEGSEEK